MTRSLKLSEVITVSPRSICSSWSSHTYVSLRRSYKQYISLHILLMLSKHFKIMVSPSYRLTSPFSSPVKSRWMRCCLLGRVTGSFVSLLLAIRPSVAEPSLLFSPILHRYEFPFPSGELLWQWCLLSQCGFYRFASFRYDAVDDTA